MKFLRFVRPCWECGNIGHKTKECDMPAMLGMCDLERDIANEARRDKQTVLVAVVVCVLAYLVISALGGVTP